MMGRWNRDGVMSFFKPIGQRGHDFCLLYSNGVITFFGPVDQRGGVMTFFVPETTGSWLFSHSELALKWISKGDKPKTGILKVMT